jgi:hypothetical protein
MGIFDSFRIVFFAPIMCITIKKCLSEFALPLCSHHSLILQADDKARHSHPYHLVVGSGERKKMMMKNKKKEGSFV